MSQNLEKIDKDKISLSEIEARFYVMVSSLRSVGKVNETFYTSDKIYTIADYRRDFNNKYCEDVDILIWGESDALMPKQTFEVLDLLHTNNINKNTYKYNRIITHVSYIAEVISTYTFKWCVSIHTNSFKKIASNISYFVCKFIHRRYMPQFSRN